jgi:hypothetical protein
MTILGSPYHLAESVSSRSISTPPITINGHETGHENGNGNGAQSLTSRARSFAGSMGRSSNSSSKRDSIRTENGKRGSMIIDSASVVGLDRDGEGEREKGGMVLDIPQEKDKGVLKRLSSIMRRDSAS